MPKINVYLPDALAAAAATPAASFARLAEGLQRRMTPRLVSALAVARSNGDGALSSLDLLSGLLDDGENLAVRLLVSQDDNTLRDQGAAHGSREAFPVFAESADLLFARLTMPARAACAAALETVAELGHNYVGCEHLLVGLVATDGGAAELLARHGVRADALRQALRGAIAGVVHERSWSTGQSADEFAALTRRIEVIEHQLAESAPK